MAPYITRYVGRFNWADQSERSAQLSVYFEVGGNRHVVSDCVEIDGPHDFDPADIDIVDAVDLIEKAIERYWINTAREEKRQAIALFRANQSSIRKAWLLDNATRHQKRAAIEHKRFLNFLSEYEGECEREAENLADAA